MSKEFKTILGLNLFIIFLIYFIYAFQDHSGYAAAAPFAFSIIHVGANLIISVLCFIALLVQQEKSKALSSSAKAFLLSVFVVGIISFPLCLAVNEI